MAQTTSYRFCEACNLQLHPNNYEQHVSGKKHKIKQDQYNFTHKTIYVTGVQRFKDKDLESIFRKYGEVFKVIKNPGKPFAFIQFTEKDSVDQALKARIFARGVKLFIHRYNGSRCKQDIPVGNKEKSRKLSETLSNTSLGEGAAEDGTVGVPSLPVQLREPEWGVEGNDFLLWQAQDFVSQVELSPEEYQSLQVVKADVENLFSYALPGCQVLIFGSCGSTLAFKNSDVDLFLMTADGKKPKDFVRHEAKAMYRSQLFNVVARIPAARVPIIKFVHVKTGWQGDLTANSQLGVCNSRLIRFLVSLDPRVKPLVMVIKYWAKVCGLTGANTKFTTYSLVMLVIYYLQQLDPPVLPTIVQLQRMSQHKQYSLGWECSFCDEEWRVQSECLSQPNNLPLRELLTGFFRFYHNFDFNNVVCPLLGRSIPVQDFDIDDGNNLPDEMSLYKEKLKDDPKCKFRTDVSFRVQDPFELCINITRNVTVRTFVMFKEACKVSLELCEKEDDSTLLKSLFSIESLDSEDLLNIILSFNEKPSDSSEVPDSVFEQWYQLTMDAIMLVFTQIMKFNVDPHCAENLKKVKKLESSQDVHTPMSKQEGEKVFVCCGKANIWESRRKMSRFMNSMNIALTAFEKEVCISNALYSPNNENLFSFTVAISSLEDLKKSGNIHITLKLKKEKTPLVKGFVHFMKTDFKVFVNKAGDFINKLKSSSPVSELKEALTGLFDLKLENLPDLKELLKKRNAEKLAGDACDEKVAVKQSVNTASQIKTTIPLTRKDKKRSPKKDENPNTTPGKVPVQSAAEYEVMKQVISPKNMPSAETQILIDEFFKPKSPCQIKSSENSNERLQSSETEKFNDLLQSVQRIETQSTFTSDETNPFLASIEKVALKPMCEGSKSEKQNEMKMKCPQSEVRRSGDKGEADICSEGKVPPTDLRQEQPSTKRKENEDQGEVNTKMLEESKGFVKNNEVVQTNTGINQDVPSSSSHDNSIQNKVVDEKTGMDQEFPPLSHRPEIHSERPLKQKKPNKPNQSAPQKKNSHPWNGTQCQPWVGGGPPHCVPWKRPPRDCSSDSTRAPPNHQYGSEMLQNPPNKWAQRQRKGPQTQRNENGKDTITIDYLNNY